MTRIVATLSLLVSLVVVLAACGGSTPVAAPNDVQMGGHSFVQSRVTIKAGEVIRFSDLANGGELHIICSGERGRCNDDPASPADLRGKGFRIGAGQSREVTFARAGSYKVTCSLHPSMNVTITVQ